MQNVGLSVNSCAKIHFRRYFVFNYEMCWRTLNAWSFLEKCLEVIKTFPKFAIEKLILLKRRGLSQIQTAFAIEANWRHRQDDDANRRKEKPRRRKLTKTINFKLTQSTTQTDENTKTKPERLSLQIAFHTKPKIKNQTPKGVTGTRRRNCILSKPTKKQPLLSKPPTQGKGVHLSQVHQPSKRCTNRAKPYKLNN